MPLPQVLRVGFSTPWPVVGVPLAISTSSPALAVVQTVAPFSGGPKVVFKFGSRHSRRLLLVLGVKLNVVTPPDWVKVPDA